MAVLRSDELVKPDMQAVLARTHLAFNLHDFLLPVFEAVSNAMHGIEALHKDDPSGGGKIHIRFTAPNNPAKFKVSIADNGIGLNDENYKSFKTPFSGHKLKQHGRGFGRFIAFKVFVRAIYSSRYDFFSQQKIRSFQFNITDKKELRFLDGKPAFNHAGLQVEYCELAYSMNR